MITDYDIIHYFIYIPLDTTIIDSLILYYFCRLYILYLLDQTPLSII